MKRIVKWLFRVFFLAATVLILAVVFRDAILKAAVEHQIRAETGLDARVGNLHLGLREPVVRVENLKIYNTDEFGSGPLLILPELHVEYDRAALLSQKVHLRLVRFNLAEVTVVENKNGKTNVEAVQEKQKQKAAGSGGKGIGLPVEFTGIDTLKLTLGQARFTSLKNPSKGRIIALGVKDLELKNVKSPADISGVVFMLMLKQGANSLGTGIPAWTGAAIPSVKNGASKPGQGTQTAPMGNAPAASKRP